MINEGDCYAIEHGPYVCKLLVCVKSTVHYSEFLMMPGDFKIVSLTKKIFDRSLSKGMLSFIENLPKDVYNVVKEQYKEVKKNKKNILTDINYIK